MCATLNGLAVSVGEFAALDTMFVFGSVARGDVADTSDIDVICVLSETRPHGRYAYEFTRLPNGVDCDLNLLTWKELLVRLSTPDWHYRLFTAEVLCSPGGNITRSCSWLDTCKAWILSEAARENRISSLIDDINILRIRAQRLAGEFPSLQRWLLAELLELLLLISLEKAADLPFRLRNPISQLDRCGQLPKWWPNAAGATPVDDKWKWLKNLLHSTRFALFSSWPDMLASPRRRFSEIPSVEIPKLEIRAARAIGQIGWIDSYDSQILDWAREVSEKGGVSANHAVPDSLGSIFTVKKTGEHKTKHNRFREYDPNRKRLKFILSTGGCNVPTCTFCALPRLSTMAPKDEKLHILSTEWEEEVQMLVIYTDGSFFDDRELSPHDRLTIAKIVRERNIQHLQVESLPRFLSLDALSPFLEALAGVRLTIGVGIQSTDENIRHTILGTPISDDEIRELLMRKHDVFSLRIYLLYGKPLMSRKEDEDDIVRSYDALAPFLSRTDIVTVNYLLPAASTPIATLVGMGLYESPHMCSLRALMDRLRASGGVVVEPGCVYTRTCVDDSQPSRNGCEPCVSFLTSLELGRPSNARQCVGSREAPELPWTIFGDIVNRCRYVADFR